MSPKRPNLIVAALFCFVGCATEREDELDGGIMTAGLSTDGTGDEGFDPDDKFDVADGAEGGVPCEEGGDCPSCDAPIHTPCDQNPADLVTAIGLGCPGENPVMASQTGSHQAMQTRDHFGDTDEWAPTEGQRYAVLGSGLVDELDFSYEVLQWPCNDDLDNPYKNNGTVDPGPLDPGPMLPQPVVAKDVGAVTCVEDPNLIGTGDCSNTLQTQFEWEQPTKGAHDYTEIRFTTTVPETASSFSYDVAFFSVEYPMYFGTLFNDLYVGWLESENWTGNVSFDEQGNPISLNAGFLDFKDAPADPLNMDPECMEFGCVAPELHGTCMQGHAGTKWLTTTASVEPGEEITVVFAIFDLNDSVLDSYAFLDNWQWGCRGDEPPSTVPIG
jgi:hypothetical protein